MVGTPAPPSTPPPLKVAASLLAVEGICVVAFAILQAADLDAERRAAGVSTAAFFGAYGVLLAAAGWGLNRRAAWSRGPALLSQLIWLGVAWWNRDVVVAAVALALVALVVLAGILHRDSIEALAGEPVDE